MATNEHNPKSIMKTIPNNKGFTVVEVMISLAIFVFIIGALTLLSRNLWQYNSFLSSGLNTADATKNILKTMTAEIRTASSGSNGGYAINQASVSSFTFYADTDNDGLKEKIRYFIDGTVLKKGIIVPTGSPLDYTQTEKITTLASNITNTNIFEYYDTNYDGTTPPLSSPINVAAVRLVKITVTIDEDPNRSPGPSTISTQVSIRNLKDNL